MLDYSELVRQLGRRMIYFEADDGRICFVFDYLGNALAGCTDIPDRASDQVRATDEELGYMFQSLRALFPTLSSDQGQIVHVYSGIPLLTSHPSSPRLISRGRSAPATEPVPGRPFTLISLVGGTWTTFRGFAEEVADAVLGGLGRTRQLSTRNEAVGGRHG